MIHVVCGPPCAGKSTYVDRHAPPGAVRVDLDRIAEALGSAGSHEHGKPVFEAALAARDAAIRSAAARGDELWAIHTLPTDAQLAEWEAMGAQVRVLDPGRDEAKARARRDGRPEGTEQAIDKWYTKLNEAAYERLSSYLAPHGANASPGPAQGTETPGPARGETSGPHGPESEKAMAENEAAETAAPEKDWQAEARKWEERSKANRDKAKAYDELSEAHEALKAEHGTAAERIAALERELGEMRAAKERDASVADAAARHKVDPELLSMMAGTTAEEIDANAEALAKKVGALRRYPEVGDQGASSAKPTATKADIAKLRGKAQFDAIAQNIGLYRS